MAQFKRIAIVEYNNRQEIIDYPNDYFNEFIAAFDNFEQGTLKKELKQNDFGIELLMPNKKSIVASLPDGRLFTYNIP